MADVTLYVRDSKKSTLRPVKLKDNGDGTYSISSIIGASAVVIGKVGIDQTTPGTTNRVDVGAALPAGSNLIGKVSEPATVETPFTGTGNLVAATNKITPGAAFKFTELELHLSAAPTTGTQNLVIAKDDGVGSAYDAVILTLDLVANAVLDLRIKPNIVCKSADVITVTWTNTDGRTYGLIFKHQLL